MAQVWANFVVTGGNGCNCCGGSSPSCNYVCVMTYVTGCPSNPADNCSAYSYPYTANICANTVDSFIPCPCFDPPSSVVITGNVYLELSGLTTSQNYSANVIFNISDDTAQSSYEWIFTAANTAENTTATNIPNPNTTGDMGWYVVGCNVNPIA